MTKTKIFKAEAKAGKVFVGGQEVPQTEILSQGKAASKGVMLLNGPDKVYIAVPVDSLKEILGLIKSLAATAAGGVLASNGGGNITTPDFAANMQKLAQAAEDLKDNLQ